MSKGVRFYLFSFTFLGTLWLSHQQNQLNWGEVSGVVLFSLCALCCLWAMRWRLRPVCYQFFLVFLLAAGCAYSFTSAHILWRLEDRLPADEENRIFRLQVEIQSLPEVRERSVQFVARVLAARPETVPETILVRWFAPDWGGPYQRPEAHQFPSLQPGQFWQITAVLRTPHGVYNQYGFDYEQYAFAQGWRALATVRGEPERLTTADLWRSPADVADSVLPAWLSQWLPAALFLKAQRWRGELKAAMAPFLADEPWGKIIQALTIGDRSAFNADDWQLFNRSGLTHLISISGTHISLVAGSMGALLAFLLRRFAVGAPLLKWRPAAFWGGLAAVAVAALYSGIAGWGVPARRSFFMLLLVVVGYLSGISLSRWQLLCSAALVVLLFDPWALLSSGFWLSFGAVAVLLACLSWSGQQSRQIGHPPWHKRAAALYQFTIWQLIITLLLWPILVWHFYEFSLVSIISNLYAITLLGTIGTPLSLLFALCAWFFGEHLLSKLFLYAALLVIEATMRPTEWLVQSPWAALAAARPPQGVVVISLLGMVVALVPRFWNGQKWFWLAVLPALFWPNKKIPAGAWSIEVLDVGQGLAVVIETRHHTFVYDTGKRSGPDSDDAQRVLIPYLRARGVDTLDGVIISHADLDHIGGLRSLMTQYRIRNYFSSFALLPWWRTESARLGATDLVPELAAPSGAVPEHLYYCQQGLSWTVDEVHFHFLWPLRPLTTGGNNTAERNAASCVLAIEGRYHRALLTGDIGLDEEERLLDFLDNGPYAVVVVPHHGSRHGSGSTLVQRVQACLAVAGTGWWNRFNHPHPDAAARWQQGGALMLSTHRWGSVRVSSQSPQLQWRAQRWHQRYYWHHPLDINQEKNSFSAELLNAKRCNLLQPS